MLTAPPLLPLLQQATETEAAVQGSFPSWLSGSMVLNGGGDYTGMKHMFDGFSVLSKMRIQGGKVYGTQRYLESQAYSHFKRTGGTMRWREFGTPLPAATPLDTARNLLDTTVAMVNKRPGFTDNASVNVIPLPNGQAMVLSESKTSAYRIDPKVCCALPACLPACRLADARCTAPGPCLSLLAIRLVLLALHLTPATHRSPTCAWI